MNVVRPMAWTRGEFLRWVTSQDEPYEFDGARPVRLTRSDNNHGRLVRNLVGILDRQLDPATHEVFGPETGIATAGEAIRYPDVVVARGPVDGRARVVDHPLIVFEVLSPSSLRLDRFVKVREYAAVSSILRYVIVETTFRGLTVLHRATGTTGWAHAALAGDDVLPLPEIGLELPLASIYDRVDLDAAG